MPVKKFDGYIIHTGGKDCSIMFPNDEYVYAELSSAFADQEKVTVEIKTRRNPRTLKQNAYLHMCLQMIADETGNDLETVKSTVKAMYAKKPLLDRDGELIYDKDTGEQAMYVQDTRDMSTIEAMTFTENVRLFAQDFCGIVLPLPDEQINLKIN